LSKVKGDSIRFYKGNTVLDLEMEVSLNASMDTIESTVKGNAWKTFKSGDKTWSVSGKANIDWSQDYNISEVFTDITAGNTIGVSIGYDSNFYTGGGILTKWTLEAAHNDLGRFSFELQGGNVLTETSTLNNVIPLTIPFSIS